MRTIAQLLVAAAIAAAAAWFLYPVAHPAPAPARPDPYGLPITCSADLRACWQRGRRVVPPREQRPCLPNSNAFWTSVGAAFHANQAGTDSERGLFRTFACLGAE